MINELITNGKETDMAEEQTEAPSSGPQIQVTPSLREEPRTTSLDSSVPVVGRRAAFRDVRRQLTEEELKSPGVHKLLLEMLQEVDDEREELRSYVSLYHESDKRAAVLSEKVITQTAIEVLFGVGVGLGGAVLGLAPFYWAIKPEYGVITAIVGLGLIVGATAGRIIKK